jgi:integrase
MGPDARTYIFYYPFFGYLHKKNARWNQEPEAIRALVKEFLREVVACQVTRDQDADGYKVQLSGESILAPSSLRVLFAALSDFYAVMAEAGLYAHGNPMRSEILSRWKREHLKQIENAGAPDHAGTRGESWEDTWQYPTAFFRQKQRHLWKPALALEPALVLKRVENAINIMIEHAPTQRDRVILLLLNHTGARISEILGLTAGGYRKARQACRALVTNKGSLGREEKTIYFTPAIERALVHYIRTERALHDPLGRKSLEQLEDLDPLFLTRRGTTYRRHSFYYHWRNWLASIPPDEHTDQLGPVAMRPHDIRHAYVTRILRQMKLKYERQPEKLSSLRWALQHRMAWRSSLTIQCYDHSESDREKLEQFATFLEDLELQGEEQKSPFHMASAGDGKTDLRVVEMREKLSTATQSSSQEVIDPIGIHVQRGLDDLSFWKDDV